MSVTYETELKQTGNNTGIPVPASDAGAQSFFDGLAPSYRKAYVTNVETAKTDATRQRRLSATVEKLSAHRKS